MAITTLPLQDHIAEQSEIAVTYNTLSAQFGDGYEQTAAAGINNKQKTWSVTYNTMDESTANTVLNYLDTVGGHIPFYATPRGEAQQTWRLIPSSLKIQHIVVSSITDEVYRSVSFQCKRAYL